jgi:hypothetical protein
MTASSMDEGNGPLEPTFDSILNFRDVGETVNEFLGRRLMRKGLLYRSARPGTYCLSDCSGVVLSSNSLKMMRHRQIEDV